MIGRAGRTSSCIVADSYLVVNPNERKLADQLMNSQLPPVESAVKNEDLNRLVLEAVVSQLCTSKEHLSVFLNLTLLAVQFQKDLSPLLDSSLDFLLRSDILTEEDGKFRSTHLGRSILASGLSPEEGLCAFLDMRDSLKNLCLHNDLHLIYLGAPINSCIRVNWELYLDLLNKLTEQDQALLKHLGVSQEVVCYNIMDPPRDNAPRDKSLITHLRFYQALVIYSLQRHQNTAEVFGIEQGVLQSFIRTAGCYLAMMSQFAAKLNWWPLHSLLVAMRTRAEYVQHEELRSLLKISGVNLVYARVLYEHGYNSIGQVAKAPLNVLERLFQRACIPAPAAIAESVSISSRKTFARLYMRRSLRN
jgi:replicative superfamily II helicase